MQHITFRVVGQHNSKALLEAAGTAVAITGTGFVLWATHASLALGSSDAGVRLLAVIAPAVRTHNRFGVVSASVEDAADLGGSTDDDDVKVTVFDGGDLLATCHQTEHAAFDGDALGGYTSTAARQGLGCIGQLVVTSECGDVGRIEKRNVAHDCVTFLLWLHECRTQ